MAVEGGDGSRWYAGGMARRVNALAELEARRRFRAIAAKDLRATGAIEAFAAEIAQRQRRGERASRAIDDLVPSWLAGLCVGVTVRGGVVTIRAADAGARHHIGQWLRSGGEGEVKARARVGVKRVKVV